MVTVCLTKKGRQLERNFEELKPASHVPFLGTILNIIYVFVAVFSSPLNSLNLDFIMFMWYQFSMFLVGYSIHKLKTLD
jgi:hypothetical protein